MADVSFNIANPYQTQLEELARRQKMAEIMQQQAFQPIERSSYQGIEAPISPLSGIAKALQMYMGGREQNKISEERKALGEKYRQESMGDITQFAEMVGKPAVAAAPGSAEFMPTGADYADRVAAPDFKLNEQGMVPAVDPVAARMRGQIDPAMIGQFKTPEMQRMALAQLLKQGELPAAFNLGVEETRFQPPVGGGIPVAVARGAAKPQEFGTTPSYEKDPTSPTGFVSVLYGKNGERKVIGPASPMNQYTTGTVDAALQRDMDMYKFGNLSADQRVSLGIRLTQAGVDISRLSFETGQGPAPQPVLPPNAPVPNFGTQTLPPGQSVAPRIGIPPQGPAALRIAIPPQGSVRPVQPVAQPVAPSSQPTSQARPSGVTPKAWAEIQAKQSEAQFEKTKGATTVIGLLNGIEDLIDKAHGGFFGNVYGGLEAAVGKRSEANIADSQLNVIAGALTSQMPKMSGPQSDKDVLLYRQMAGDIGNPNIGAEAKKAAVATVRGIQDAYINGFSATGYLPKGRSSSGVITNTEAPTGAVRRIR